MDRRSFIEHCAGIFTVLHVARPSIEDVQEGTALMAVEPENAEADDLLLRFSAFQGKLTIDYRTKGRGREWTEMMTSDFDTNDKAYTYIVAFRNVEAGEPVQRMHVWKR